MIRSAFPILSILFLTFLHCQSASNSNSNQDGSEPNVIPIEDAPYGECAKANAKLKPNSPVAFVPKCTKNGHYELLQCSSSLGKCFCVQADSGQKINGTETVNDADSPVVCPVCAKSKHQVLKALPPFFVGAVIPQCDDNGLYTTTQCHGSTGYCWCVHPVTGEELNGSRIPPGTQNRPDCDQLTSSGATTSNLTKTNDNRVNQTLSALLSAILPPLIPLNPELFEPAGNSSNNIDSLPSKSIDTVIVKGSESKPKLCHELKANLKKGQRSDRPLIGAFVPKCTEEGHFERIQNHGSTGYSWCVDEIGREIPGTRVRGHPECDANAGQENICSLPKSIGWDCGRKQPRWFYNEQKRTCFSFTYTGCGGNMNNFATLRECEKCYAADGPSCSSEESRWKNQTKPCAKLNTFTSNNNTVDIAECPVGYECRTGIITQCCNTTIEKMFQESWDPQCGNGTVLTVNMGDYNQTVIAETCEDMLCPEGYTCAMGPMFAHCCSDPESHSNNPLPSDALSDSSDDHISLKIVGKLCSVARDGQSERPPPGAFTPSCTEEGGFDAVQCHGSTGQCWCADSLGKEIPQTRVRNSRQHMNCTGDFNLNPLIGCFEKKHNGYGCGVKQRRWYFNEPKQSCFAFIYNGCGGTLNNFETLRDCQLCRQSDGGICATQEGYMANQTGICRFSGLPSNSKASAYECPKGFECKNGPFSTHCCNSTIEKQFRESYSPTCRDGQQPFQVPVGAEYNATLLAENCEDLLCPNGYACTLSPLLAHCCPLGGASALDHILSPGRGVHVGAQQEMIETSEKSPSITFDAPAVFVQTIKNCTEVNRLLTPSDPGFTGWFAPRCTKEGSYQKQQCSSTGFCWCVDSQGRELPNTRVGPGEGPVKCEGFFGLRDHCAAPKHSGWDCNDNLMRWYYNTDRRKCISFKYNGCGGTTNNFLTLAECQKCIPRGGPICSTSDAQLGNQTQQCNKAGPDGKVRGCPPGYVCKMGEIVSACCNGTMESLFLESQTHVCPTGEPYQISTSTFKQVLIADDCENLICPKGHKCTKALVDAHCCPEHPSGDEPHNPERSINNNNSSTSIDSGLQTSQEVTHVVGPKPIRCIDAAIYLRAEVIADAPFNRFIPRCSVDGSYESKQCFNGSCWCVDGVGQEIYGSRTNSTSPLSCEHIEAPRIDCSSPKDSGFGCGLKQERFYYNPKTMRCARFVYTGCGGNGNNYDSLQKCWQCMPSDLGPCSEEASYLSNQTGPCLSPRGAPTVPCPSGFECRMGAFFGVCCNKAIEELHTQSTSETCKHGKALKTGASSGLPGLVVTADSCEDLLCPDGYECAPGPKAARCCPLDNSTLTNHKAKPSPTVSFSQDSRDSRCNSLKPTYAPVQARSPESLWFFSPSHSKCQEFLSLRTEDRDILFPTKKECEDACVHAGADVSRVNCSDPSHVSGPECGHPSNLTRPTRPDVDIIQRDDATLNNSTSKCHTERNKAKQLADSNGPGFVGNFIPQCKETAVAGQFERIQCHGSTGYCWCVHEETGEEQSGTKLGPGQGPPSCEGKVSKLCSEEQQKRFELCQRPIRFNFPSPVLLKEPLLVASLCASQQDYIKCVSAIRCLPTGQPEAYDRLYRKLCDQGGFPYTKYATCLTSVMKLAAVQGCNGVVNLSPNSNVTCDQLINQLRCAKYHISGLCGTEAYGIIQDYMETFTRSWTPACQLNSQSIAPAVTAVQRCAQEQKDFLMCVSQPVPKAMSTPLSIIESTSTVQKACAMHTAFVVSNCRRPNSQCDDHLLNGVENVLQTLCNYIYHDYLQFRTCLLDAAKSQDHKCFREPPTLAMFNSTEDLQMCANVNSELRCLHTALSPECKLSMGTTLDTVYQRFLDSWNPACPLLPTIIPDGSAKPDSSNQFDQTVAVREAECNISETARILGCSTHYANQLVPITVIMSGTDLDEICSSFNRAKICVGQIDCRVPQISGFTAMLDLICSEGGQADYLQHSSCWGQLKKRPEIQACLVPHKGIDPTDFSQKERLCQSLSATMTCIQPSLLQVCNRRAFDLIFAYHLAFAEGYSSCKLDLQVARPIGTTEPPMFLPVALSTTSANVSCMHNLIEPMLELSKGSPHFDSFCDGTITKFEICRIRQQSDGAESQLERSLGKFLNGFCFERSNDNDTDCANPVYRDLEAARCAHEFLLGHDGNDTNVEGGKGNCAVANRFLDCLLVPVGKKCVNGDVPKILAELHDDISIVGCVVGSLNESQHNRTVAVGRHSESDNFCTEPLHKYLYPFTFVKGVASHTEICSKLPLVYAECRTRPGGLMGVNDGDAAVLQLITQICFNPEMKKRFVGAVGCTFGTLDHSAPSACLKEYTRQFGDSINLKMIMTDGDVHCRSILSLYGCIAPHLINSCGWNVFETLLSLEELFLEPLLPGCGLRLAERAKWYLSNITHTSMEQFLFYTLFAAQISSTDNSSRNELITEETAELDAHSSNSSSADISINNSTLIDHSQAATVTGSASTTTLAVITESTTTAISDTTTNLQSLGKAPVESENKVAQASNDTTVIEELHAASNHEIKESDQGCVWQRNLGKSADANDASANAPQCQPNGQFQKLQCNTKTGYCWCVSESTGVELNDTRNGPGQPLPRCDDGQVYACDKLPWKDGCEPDGRKPQLVLRWYRNDRGRCGVYMHSYCTTESFSPPVAIKYESLCERICLRQSGTAG